MFRRLGQGAVTYPWLVVGIWLLLGLALSLVAPAWDTRTQDDDIHFLPDRCPSVRGYHLLEKAFPQDVFASRLLFVLEREEGSLTDSDFALVDQLVGALEELRRQAPELKIGSISSYQDGLIGSRLVSPDRQCTLIQVSLGTPYLALQTQTTVTRAEQVVRARMAAVDCQGLRLFTSGAAGLGRDLTKSYGDSLDRTTLATVVLVVVVLLLVYRAPLLALVPLATIAISVWVALKLLALLTLIPGVHLVNISKIFAIVIMYGAGTDYCLFLISRYREELEAGQELVGAVVRAVAEVGGALTASAGTVACGLGLMGLSEFAKVRYAGPGIALSLVVALAATLTLTPALLCLLGRTVFWPCQPPTLLAQHRARRHDLWQRLSRYVAIRPLLVWCLASAVLLPLMIIGFRVTPSYRPTSQLSPSSESLQGLAALERHFTAGEVGPLTVLLASPEDWDSTLGRLQIDHLSRGFACLPNVAEVRSLTQPLGRPLLGIEAAGTPGFLETLLQVLPSDFLQRFLEEARQLTRQHYVAVLSKDTSDGRPLYVTRLDLILRSDPFDPASITTLQQVQAWLDQELPLASFTGHIRAAEVYGVMVNTHDLEQITESDRTRINTLILTGIFLILLALVRQPLLAAYLLLTVLASYYATLGATALANLLWGGTSAWQLDWRVLFFLFTILISVGEDYNILLLTRALREAKHFGAYEGMRRALARTGSTISSCGLIMAGTFATLMLASLGALLQIGFALAFGVLLDTFLVRPFLVPAFTLMLARDRATPPPPAARQASFASVPRRFLRLAAG